MVLDDQNLNEENGQTPDPAEERRARTQRAEIERQIVILESDLKKIIQGITDVEIQKRKLEKEEKRIRVERDVLDRNMKALDNDRKRLEEEIRNLKKDLKKLQ